MSNWGKDGPSDLLAKLDGQKSSGKYQPILSRLWKARARANGAVMPQRLHGAGLHKSRLSRVSPGSPWEITAPFNQVILPPRFFKGQDHKSRLSRAYLKLKHIVRAIPERNTKDFPPQLTYPSKQ
jgi:hypothetical protein